MNIESLDGEEWKDIIGYEGLYKISNYGRVMTFFRGNEVLSKEPVRLLKGKIDKDGYIEYRIGKNGKSKYVRSHRLVAIHFIPNPENKAQVNHIDGVKNNNHISNLEWCTNSENALHKFKIGLGEKSKDVASYTHGKRCKLISIETGEEYIFNSMMKTSLFLEKRSSWMQYYSDNIEVMTDKIKELGYILEMEELRTYERIIKKS